MAREELLKVGKPILFNTKMVQAILDGRKTVTRRAVKNCLGLADTDKNDRNYLMIPDTDGDYHHAKDYCRYQVGDLLYVRETFCEVPYEYEHFAIKDGHITIPKIAYKADSEIDYTGIWKPSIHMPKELARIFLKVTDVKVERICNMLTIDFLNEGIELYKSDGRTEKSEIKIEYEFEDLWDSTVKKDDLSRYGWEASPWVYVIEFERVVPK